VQIQSDDRCIQTDLILNL